MRIGALEAGGTKMVMGIFDGDGQSLETETISTRAPEKTVPELIDWFRREKIDALGIGTFGPVNLKKDSPSYGTITSTPKAGWRGYPLLTMLTDALNVPAAIDTDVNAAAIAECRMGAAKDCRSAVYVTVGTGIGAGIVVNGEPVHGLVHPEVGHMLMRPHPLDPMPQGVCPYHESCLEGLASGPALSKRAGRSAEELPDGDPIFTLEANYLAQLCVNLILTVSPEKIMIGGGVLQRSFMLDRIRKITAELLGGYVQAPEVNSRIDRYIVLPKLFPISGLIGAYLLGREALTGEKE